MNDEGGKGDLAKRKQFIKGQFENQGQGRHDDSCQSVYTEGDTDEEI